MSERQAYPSDLTDEEWRLLEPLRPPARHDVRPRKYALREVVNGLRYLQRSGCLWRMLPHEFSPTAPCTTTSGSGVWMGLGNGYINSCTNRCAA